MCIAMHVKKLKNKHTNKKELNAPFSPLFEGNTGKENNYVAYVAPIKDYLVEMRTKVCKN